MYVVNPERRAGLLVSVITGGRPKLEQRPTAAWLADLADYGIPAENIVWTVAEHHADGYERDKHPLLTYSTDWAFEYAREHWTAVDRQPEHGGFLGAFPGREFAALEAEKRGCWGVLQLDDNIKWLGVIHDQEYGRLPLLRRGGLAFTVDMLAAVALSTNSRMTGAQLSATIGDRQSVRAAKTFARPGFPYSLFIETVGPGREHWHGPFEDDIMHALQYGRGAAGYTAALLPWLKYCKESTSNTGMRKVYDHTRAVALQRMFPDVAKIMIKSAKSNGRGGPRVFHHMLPGAVRNPLRVLDRELFTAAIEPATEAITEAMELRRANIRRKVEGRTPA
jgi:hypothetical protein